MLQHLCANRVCIIESVFKDVNAFMAVKMRLAFHLLELLGLSLYCRDRRIAVEPSLPDAVQTYIVDAPGAEVMLFSGKQYRGDILIPEKLFQPFMYGVSLGDWPVIPVVEDAGLPRVISRQYLRPSGLCVGSARRSFDVQIRPVSY